MIMEIRPWEGPYLHDHDARVGCRLLAGIGCGLAAGD